MNRVDFYSVRLGPESISEALAHDCGAHPREGCEADGKQPSLSQGKDRPASPDPLPTISPTNDVASSDAVPDAPQISAPAAGGASTPFDGLRDMPAFLRRTAAA